MLAAQPSPSTSCALASAARCLAFAIVSLVIVSAANAQPANDDFANAFTIRQGETVTSTNVGATEQAGEPDHTGNMGGKSVWWRLTALTSGQITVRTCGSNFDTLLAVYIGEVVNALTLLAQNDNDPACGGLQSQLTFHANEGQTYSIVVDGFGSDPPSLPKWVEEGLILLSVSPPSVCNARAGLGDFNGDGNRDLLFRRTTGELALYLMSGFQIAGAQGIGGLGPDWILLAVADFNGDGRSDMLFRRRSDGTLVMFLMDGFRIAASQVVGQIGEEWRFIGPGDFNGDGRSDLMFVKDSTRQQFIYFMDGFNIISAQAVFMFAPGVGSTGIGWFNGDNKSDILARYSADGGLYLVLMNDVTAPTYVGVVGLDTFGLESAVGAVGDFDGNGRSDILLRRNDGLLALYLVAGDPPGVTAGLLGHVGPEWVLVGVGDFNNDGKADTLFRRADGALALYLWNGFNLVAAQVIGQLGPEWTNCLPNP